MSTPKMPRTWWSPTDGLVQDVPTALYVHVTSGEPMVSVPDDAIELRPIQEASPAPEGEAGPAASGAGDEAAGEGSVSCGECRGDHCTDPGDSCSRTCCPRCRDAGGAEDETTSGGEGT